MQQANTNSKPAPLPLFRAEALAARQQGTQGDILLVRPLSLAFLSWLGGAIAALVMAYLFLGHYTPREQLEGTVTPAEGAYSALLVETAFDTTEPQLQKLQPGRKVLLRCTPCARPLAGTIVRVLSISSHSPGSTHNIHSLVTIALPPGQKLPAGTKVQAEIRLEEKPLIAWLLEKPGS